MWKSLVLLASYAILTASAHAAEGKPLHTGKSSNFQGVVGSLSALLSSTNPKTNIKSDEEYYDSYEPASEDMEVQESNSREIQDNTSTIIRNLPLPGKPNPS